MEFGLRKYSEIALIFYDLLDGNYECARLFIDKLKDVEIDDSRKYHIERYILKPPVFASYSFLFTLRGVLSIDGKIIKGRKMVIERIRKIKKFKSDSVCKRILPIIYKYNILLNSKNITENQQDTIHKMISFRIKKYNLLIVLKKWIKYYNCSKHKCECDKCNIIKMTY